MIEATTIQKEYMCCHRMRNSRAFHLAAALRFLLARLDEFRC